MKRIMSKSSINVPKLERFYLYPGKYDDEISKYYPNNPLRPTLNERIEYYTDLNSFRHAWDRVYQKNESRIEAFIRGDYAQMDRIDFNNLVKLFSLAWPVEQIYHKDPGNYTLQDYMNIANRLWAINMYRH